MVLLRCFIEIYAYMKNKNINEKDDPLKFMKVVQQCGPFQVV